jgi:hypothetical protein
MFSPLNSAGPSGSNWYEVGQLLGDLHRAVCHRCGCGRTSHHFSAGKHQTLAGLGFDFHQTSFHQVGFNAGNGLEMD